MATMIEATAPSPFGSGSIGRIEGSATPVTGTTSTTGTIAVTAVPVTDAAPGSVPGQSSPTSPQRLDLPPLLEPTGSNGVVHSYLVAAAGPTALSSLAAAGGTSAGGAVPSHAMIRVHDGHSGRSVVMASREGVGDGRLVITVVFN
ncbi:MAG: hypothetical protein ACKO5J_02220 [Rubrivivax sp.]